MGTAGDWTPRRRFETVLRGEMPDRVPFVVWDNKLPGGDVDRALLQAGACVVCKTRVYTESLEGVRVESRSWTGADGNLRRETVYHTPYGDLAKTDIHWPDTVWHVTPPFRGPADYERLIAWVDSRRYTPCFDEFMRRDAAYGAAGIGRPTTEATPMRELIYELMGVETFAQEWAERRDHVIALYRALLEARRRALPILAASPAQFFIVEANIAFDIVGDRRFREFYRPAIQEACAALRAAGKLTGAHLDGNNRRLAPLVADLGLDFIESFTPPPDCDMSVREARAAWPGLALVCNFPSSAHLGGPDAVRDLARRLLGEAAPGAGFALGVLENVPRVDTLPALAEYIAENASTPLAE